MIAVPKQLKVSFDGACVLDMLYIPEVWHGYFGLADVLGFECHTVNHSQILTDLETGIDTNTIEGTCDDLKMRTTPRDQGRSNVEDDAW